MNRPTDHEARMWWATFVSNRRRRDYSYSCVGASRPNHLQSRPTKHEMLAAANRMEYDGDIENAQALRANIEKHGTG